jgi:sec-independent protein translocase protein TatA
MNLPAISMLGFLSTWHIVVILVVVLLLFGGKKLPELAKGLGQGLRVFKDELHGISSGVEQPPLDQQSKPTQNPTDKPPETKA